MASLMFFWGRYVNEGMGRLGVGVLLRGKWEGWFVRERGERSKQGEGDG